jgi:D-tyrosyl-tRNA(Tyr) deacylase
MRAVLQRVTRARVSVDGETVGEIGAGLLILVCAMGYDTPDAPERMAAKIAKMRIFRDEADKMNLSLRDTGGAALVVSQFTLAADLRGNRPGFSTAAAPAIATQSCDRVVAALRAEGIAVATGRFGADMQVELVNDGPVTIWVEV